MPINSTFWKNGQIPWKTQMTKSEIWRNKKYMKEIKLPF